MKEAGTTLLPAARAFSALPLPGGKTPLLYHFTQTGYLVPQGLHIRRCSQAHGTDTCLPGALIRGSYPLLGSLGLVPLSRHHLGGFLLRASWGRFNPGFQEANSSGSSSLGPFRTPGSKGPEFLEGHSSFRFTRFPDSIGSSGLSSWSWVPLGRLGFIRGSLPWVPGPGKSALNPLIWPGPEKKKRGQRTPLGLFLTGRGPTRKGRDLCGLPFGENIYLGPKRARGRPIGGFLWELVFPERGVKHTGGLWFWKGKVFGGPSHLGEFGSIWKPFNFLPQVDSYLRGGPLPWGAPN